MFEKGYRKLRGSDNVEPELRVSIAEEDGDALLDRELNPSNVHISKDHSNLGFDDQEGSRRWRLPYGMSFAILCLLLLAAAIFSSPVKVILMPKLGDSAPNPNDDRYLLNPDWDFDASSQRREYHWTISDAQRNPDGVYRPMMLVNGQFPGPLIECNEGDTIVVHVQNQAVNATSLHWHGLFQNSTNHMDGTIGVTQCPIAPGNKFTYEFQVKRQSGTYWYHGHNGLQASDGLLGPLIIHARDEKSHKQPKYDSDRIVMVQDYYHDLSGALMMQYLQPDRENEEPIPDGALINGKNVRDCSLLTNRHCDNSTSSLSIFNLEPGKRHRLRFINVGAFAEFQISIDSHEFAVTEVDGLDVQPAYYHRLNISPGQRYSIIISNDKASAGSYWLRAKMVTHCFAGKNPHMDPEVRAVIAYSEVASPISKRPTVPKSKDWSEAIEVECKDMNVTELVPVEQVAAPPTAAVSFNIQSNFEIRNWRLSRGFFNTTSWRPRIDSPLLTRIFDGLAAGNSSFTKPGNTTVAVNEVAFDVSRELVVQASSVQVIDLVIQNFDDGNHPMHLHGYKYFVLAHGVGYFNATETYPILDVTNPLRRDTATVGPYGWLLLRFVADNPGVWALHCHITWHTEAGLLMSFATRTNVLKGLKIPDANRRLCDAKNLEKGSGPKDEIWIGA